MNTSQKKGMAFAILITAIGVAWLLNVTGVMPRVDWVWTGALGVAGALILTYGGINKITVVAGPLLIIASLLSILRQTGRLTMDLEMPILVICFGLLMILAIALRLPMPRYLRAGEECDAEASSDLTQEDV